MFSIDIADNKFEIEEEFQLSSKMEEEDMEEDVNEGEDNEQHQQQENEERDEQQERSGGHNYQWTWRELQLLYRDIARDVGNRIARNPTMPNSNMIINRLETVSRILDVNSDMWLDDSPESIPEHIRTMGNILVGEMIWILDFAHESEMAGHE